MIIFLITITISLILPIIFSILASLHFLVLSLLLLFPHLLLPLHPPVTPFPSILLLFFYFQFYSLTFTISFFIFSSPKGPGPALGEFGGEGAECLKVKKSKTSSDDSDLLEEDVKPRAKLPPLLTPLGDLKSEKLHWLGVSFGLTSQLLNFWSRKLFKVI